MPTWWTLLPVHAPVITGWTGGTRAEAWRQADAAARLAGALRTLSRMLRTDETTLAAELESWHTHDWHADPFSRGAYSYVRAGGMEAQRRFGEPVEDTLYFAGEAVNAEGHAGTVHGAMATGERAARLISAVMTQ
jgi:monoamine oxidase